LSFVLFVMLVSLLLLLLCMHSLAGVVVDAAVVVDCVVISIVGFVIRCCVDVYCSACVVVKFRVIAVTVVGVGVGVMLPMCFRCVCCVGYLR